MTKKGIFLRTMDIFSILRTIFAKFHHSPPILKACILRPSHQETKDSRILHTRIFHCRKKLLAASLITKHLDRHTFYHNILPNDTAEEIPPLLRLRPVKLRKADRGQKFASQTMTQFTGFTRPKDFPRQDRKCTDFLH